jgi:hypothetical protein
MGSGNHATGARILGFVLIAPRYQDAALVMTMDVCNARLESIFSNKMVNGLNV